MHVPITTFIYTYLHLYTFSISIGACTDGLPNNRKERHGLEKQLSGDKVSISRLNEVR